MNGAFIASRPQTVATADALATVWRDLRRGQVFPLNLLGFLHRHAPADPGCEPGPQPALRSARTPDGVYSASS